MSAHDTSSFAAPATSSFDAKALRAAAGNFVTGVTIATTTAADGSPRGVTVNSFSTVSLEPPLVLVCIGRTSRSFPAFDAATTFAINVLSNDQRQVSSTFASKTDDKFAGQDWRKGVSGSPIFPASLSVFDCELHQKIDAGDHIILIGRVIDIQRSTGTPLGYFSGNYIDFAVQRETVDATSVAGQYFGGLFRYGEEILFLEQDGKLSLPFASSLGEENREPESLLGKLDALGIKARLSFVYAVFSEEHHEMLSAVYLGEIESIDTARSGAYRLLKANDVPFDSITRFAGLVRRYLRERDVDQFGLYVGTAVKGTVHRAR